MPMKHHGSSKDPMGKAEKKANERRAAKDEAEIERLRRNPVVRRAVGEAWARGAKHREK